jgi:hypothetical protein
MFSRRAHFRRVVAIAVMMPLLVLATAFAHDLMRCRVTGVILPACVCPDAPEPAAPADATLTEQTCCERQSLESLGAAREEAPNGALLVPVPVESRLAPLPRPILDRALWRLAATRPPGRALVLLKHSFLI